MRLNYRLLERPVNNSSEWTLMLWLDDNTDNYWCSKTWQKRSKDEQVDTWVLYLNHSIQMVLQHLTTPSIRIGIRHIDRSFLSD